MVIIHRDKVPSEAGEVEEECATGLIYFGVPTLLQFRSVIHRSNRSVVQWATLTNGIGFPYWRGHPAQVAKRLEPRGPRRAELVGRAFDYVSRLESAGREPRMLTPLACFSKRSDKEQWDLYPHLPATLASANDNDGAARKEGYDKNDTVAIIREFAALADEIELFHQGTGLVHRDIKPSNIGVTHERGRTWSLLLFDFDETSHGVSGPDDTQLDFTATVDPGGGWTPPEVAFLDKSVNARVPFQSDVWGLAAVIYWCITQGALPYGARSDPEYLPRLYSGSPLRHKRLDPTLYAILSAALRRDPWGRPAMGEFADHLRSWLGTYLEARAAAIIARAKRAPTRGELSALRAAWTRLLVATEKIDDKYEDEGEKFDQDPGPWKQASARIVASWYRESDVEVSSPLVIAHLAHRIGISFAEAVHLIEKPADEWWMDPIPELVSPLLRDVIPELDELLDAAISPDGRIVYRNRPQSRATTGEPIPPTEVMPPDIVDTDLIV